MSNCDKPKIDPSDVSQINIMDCIQVQLLKLLKMFQFL